MGTNGKKQIVIQDGILINGTGDKPVKNETIVIENNRIRNVGKLPGDVNLEDKDHVQVIDAAGRWIIPGLIDAHCHLSLRQPDLKPEKWNTSAEFCTIWAARNARKTLKSGITSISSPGGKWFADVTVRNAINGGLIEGPRIFTAGRLINPVGGISDRFPPWMEDTPDDNSGVVIQNLDGMLEEVRRQIKRGVDFIKLGDSFWGDQQAFTDQEISSIVEEAHRRGARVAIHSRGSGSTRASAKAGVDWIMHADLATEEDMEAVAESGVPIVPTMTFMFNAADFASEMGYSQRGIDIVRRNTEGCVRNMELARKLGITVLSGTDTGNSPYTLHGECHMYEAEILTKYVGYTPMEAIVANTKKNAFTIGLEDQLGTVEPGKLADVLILDKDPLADITVLQNPSNIVSLIKDGAIIDTDAPEPDIDIGSFEWPGRHFTAQWLER